MGRGFRLTQLKVDREKKPGVYADGAGIYLNVTAGGSKSWLYRYMLDGKAHWMGLGSYPDISLAEAREKAAECRKLKHQGIDPLIERKQQVGVIRAAAAKAVTFDEAATQFIDANAAAWKNEKHVAQWHSTLATYASPIIGPLDVALIDVGHIVKIFERDNFWQTKPETASRVRARIESVLDWATVRKHRNGENPARWKGHMDKLLPARAKVQKTVHHAALPWRGIGAFMAALRIQSGIAARALEFAILTAARSGEVRLASWSEISFEGATWIVPAERMKAKREHRVPLSNDALALLQKQKAEFPSEGLIFPGAKTVNGQAKPLSDMSLTAVLRRMGLEETVHGFRSSFRDWAGEKTEYPNEMVEMALAHAISSKAEAAYRRETMFDKRRHLMQDWADFCNVKEGEK